MEIGIECGRHLLLSISDDDLSIARKGDYIEAARAIGHCLIERRITPAHRFGDGDKIRIALGVHKDHEKLAGCPDSAPGLCIGRQANDHDFIVVATVRRSGSPEAGVRSISAARLR
jgi:hypothetical protein